MKKSVVVILSLIITIMTICFLFATPVHAENQTVLDNQTENQFVETIEKNKKTLEDYNKQYGSEAYGMTAFILDKIRFLSIPLCFLGIAISGIYQNVIGIRKLDIKEKGLTLMVTFITILVICQIFPLAFTIVVKFGRG